MRLTRRGWAIVVITIYLTGLIVLWFVLGLGSVPEEPIPHSLCYVNQTCGEDKNGNPVDFS